MGRGHADDTSGIAFEYLPLESLGCGLAVAGDEEGCFDTLGTLPRIRNGEQYALPAVGAFDIEARGVSGRID